MKKDAWSAVLMVGIVVPLVLLLWPFAWWGSVMRLILRVIPAVCAQLLLCRWEGRCGVKWITFAATGTLALWGTYLYFTSPHWSNATWMGMIADYVSPCLSCGVVLGLDWTVRFGKRVKR